MIPFPKAGHFIQAAGMMTLYRKAGYLFPAGKVIKTLFFFQGGKFVLIPNAGYEE